MNPLALSTTQLSEIALDFEKKVGDGLANQHRQIKCLPTYISLRKQPKKGRAFVLDLGGSNLRAGVVDLENGKGDLILRSPKIKMPWQRNTPFDREHYLDLQATALAELNCNEKLPLGYCFSYSAEPTPDRDVTLLKWAKGIDVPGTLGEKMGQILLNHLTTHFPEVQCTGLTAINDTVAALIGGMADTASTSTIGLIAGTGTNMAAAIESLDIPKMAATHKKSGLLPVNLESGHFSPEYLTEWDKTVDLNSNNPGEQLFEKAVSGAYLGNIFKALFPHSAFDATGGGAELVKILNHPDHYPAEWAATATTIYHRSADLVAGALAGLIRLLWRLQNHSNIRIVAEGALFWGEIKGHHQYRDRTESTLKTILSDFKLDHLTIDFFKREHANLVGSAIAALTA